MNRRDPDSRRHRGHRIIAQYRDLLVDEARRMEQNRARDSRIWCLTLGCALDFAWERASASSLLASGPNLTSNHAAASQLDARLAGSSTLHALHVTYTLRTSPILL